LKKLKIVSALSVLLLFGACASFNNNASTGNTEKDTTWSLWNDGAAANQPSDLDAASSGKPITSSDKDPSVTLTADGGEIESIMDEAIDFCTVAQEYWQKGELENALEALDQAYALILNIDTRDQPKLIQQKENLRFMISKRILEIYASRHTVVNGDHKAIPMSMNKHVQAEINRFRGPEKNFSLNLTGVRADTVPISLKR